MFQIIWKVHYCRAFTSINKVTGWASHDKSGKLDPTGPLFSGGCLLVPLSEPRQSNLIILDTSDNMALLRQRKLVCFYCGRRSAKVQDGTVRRWECKECEAVNYLDEVVWYLYTKVRGISDADRGESVEWSNHRSSSYRDTNWSIIQSCCWSCFKKTYIRWRTLLCYLYQESTSPHDHLGWLPSCPDSSGLCQVWGILSSICRWFGEALSSSLRRLWTKSTRTDPSSRLCRENGSSSKDDGTD